MAPDARQYAANHTSRFVKTLEMTPAGDASKAILEMGAYMQITPALKFKLCYGSRARVLLRSRWAAWITNRSFRKTARTFECDVDHFDAERDIYPYSDASFDTVLCCELIEHLFTDPMHMMSEINRILKPGGHLVLTTPNLGSLRAISAILQGYHPSFFPAYIRPRKEGEEAEARHNREYVPMEVQHLLTDAGFEILRLETGEFLEEPHPEFAWINHLLDRYRVHTDTPRRWDLCAGAQNRTAETTLARVALFVSIAFRNTDVQLEGSVLRVRSELVNRSAEAWRPEDGWAAGYHLFDEPTGTLVVDGARVPLDVAPSEGRTVPLEIALPPEPGEYNIYVSACASMWPGFTTRAGLFC